MKNLKSILLLFFALILFINCKKEHESGLLINNNQEKNKLINVIPKLVKDTLINSIDKSKIGILITDKKKLISIYFKSFEKDYTKSIINFERVKDDDDKIEIKKYSDFNFNGIIYNTYLFSFYYENDAIYQSLLLVNKSLDSGLIIYERVVNEGEYLRTSRIENNLITNIQYQIDPYKYDKEGNIAGRKQKRDSSVIIINKYLINENNILEYFDDLNKKINIEWGSKELFYTKDGLDSSYIYQYKRKGRINNHLKEGEWEERKYIADYDKSVWINGKYINGIKEGEWYYSPEGPVDKIELYEKGKLIKTTKR